MIAIEGNGFIRISKKVARAMFNDGQPVYVLPHKVNLYYEWIKPTNITEIDKITFDSCVNAYSYYNCQYNELGKYVAYYKKVA